jgi:signal transduction histidine kinase
LAYSAFTGSAATESLAQNKKLTLRASVDRSLPIGLGDEQRLTQVLLNLVGNAIKFTDASQVSITAGARHGHFAISGTDTGPGIPLDQVALGDSGQHSDPAHALGHLSAPYDHVVATPPKRTMDSRRLTDISHAPRL